MNEHPEFSKTRGPKINIVSPVTWNPAASYKCKHGRAFMSLSPLQVQVGPGLAGRARNAT